MHSSGHIPLKDPQKSLDYALKTVYNSTMNAPLSTTTQSLPASGTTFTRAMTISAAARFIPHTTEGLPAGFYRADLIADDLTASAARLPSATEAAFVPLNYQEGFPALPDGRPFWNKLDYEPPAAFAAFELYVGLASDGPRYVAALLQSPELQRLYGESLSLQLLQEMHTLYYWKERARAADLYQEATNRHIRMRRAQNMQDYHFTQSDTLLRKVMDQLNTAETFDAMKHDPQVLLSAMEKLVKIQRVSVGLPSAAPLPAASQETPFSFEMVMRQMIQQEASQSRAEGTNSSSTTIDQEGRVVSSTDNLLRGALHSPDTSKLMQELIIKMSTRNGATKKPRWVNSISPDEIDEAGNVGNIEGEGEEDA